MNASFALSIVFFGASAPQTDGECSPHVTNAGSTEADALKRLRDPRDLYASSRPYLPTYSLSFRLSAARSRREEDRRLLL